MSIIAPDSTLTLYQGVEITDEKQLLFSSITDQENYFTAHIYRTEVDCSYQRPGDPLLLDIPVADLLNFNYISFKNESFEDKTIYARVKSIPTYVNNEVRAIAYEIDPWQTFCFDITADPCNIVREMISETEQTSEDTDCLKNIIPEYFTQEPLSFSDSVKKPIDSFVTTFNQSIIGGNTIRRTYDMTASGKNGVFMSILNSHNLLHSDVGSLTANWLKCKAYLVVSQPLNVSTGQLDAPVVEYNNAWGFTKACYVTSYDIDSTDQTGINDLKNYINGYVTAGATSCILGLYWLPAVFPDSDRANPVQLVENIIRVPHNGKCGKLNRFPYRYIKMKDPLGNIKEYHLEKFDTTLAKNGYMDITFGLFYTFNGYPQIILAPKNYGRTGTPETDVPSDYAGYNFKEGMIVTDFPQIAFNTDAFLTYYGNVLRGQQQAYASSAPWQREFMTADVGMNRQYASGLEYLGELGKYSLGKIGKGAGMMLTGNLGGGLSEIASIGTPSGMYAASQESVLNREAANLAGTIANVSEVEIPESLALMKASFANDEYHPGTQSALLIDYMRNMVGFEMVVFEPEDSLLNEYEKFFELYGYAANRCDVPKIMNYMSSGDLPVFFNNKTFLKTMNASINGINIEMCRAIEDMFNKGHWYEKVVST